MTPFQRARRRRGRLGLSAALTGLLATLVLAGPAAATPDPDRDPTTEVESGEGPGGRAGAAGDDGIPGVDEIVHSDNITQLANIPREEGLSGTNSDIAFQGEYAFAGNYDGFVVYDISRPRSPRLVTRVLCPGSQNDISVTGDLLFLSVDSSRSDDSCSSEGQPATEADSWEGIRVFDISDVREPRYVSAVETACGSHTHTLVPERRDVYVYVSSYAPDASFPDCQPPHDGISIVKVPRRAPERAALSRFEVLFPDGGFPGDEDGSATTGCHDITAYPALDLAAGACMGDGVLMDISRPDRPRVLDRVQDAEHFAFWHSATFSQDGSKIVFTDELGGGGAPTCDATVGDEFGANGIYHVTGRGDDRALSFQSYYKIPRHQSTTENCVAHNGSLIPVPGRDIMVQAWYQGGVSVWEFTDSDDPREIGYFERGPVNGDELAFGGSWSAYYYNGHVYSNDQKGLDVLRIDDRRTDPARRVHLDELNAQTQPTYR
ncbi:LVIVD repeat-containing protein [Streptomyces zhaozhouensis]|uniref:LVIVD repeat-containing protein n=1 Tax=Streptomyces zhaozhouensis TaxID=1300267 RepID=A0A286DWE2_9ACTN|nr:hypothetical protein [Streptomyces zhaozhouensis]SOD62985.1 LVIVD repeat-containing protein [Streptomyces zhaozhouensis]